MPLYGILKGTQNTGANDELACVFTAPLTIASNSPSFTSDTITLKRVSVSQNVQRWEIAATIASTDDATEFFLNNVTAGASQTIRLRMPQHYRGGKKMSTNLDMRTAGAFAAGETSININNTNNELLKGEFIRFANHNKIYTVVSPGSGGVGAVIYPRLTQYVPSNTYIEYGDHVTMFAKYDISTAFGIKYTDGILTEMGSHTFIEAL